MKPFLALTCLATLVATPALAARITNLDHVPHEVYFETAGTRRTEVVQPNATATFARMDGIVGMKGGTPATSRVNTDGILSGTIGNARSTQIPAGPGDEFVIWPGGQMNLQRRIKSFHQN